MNISSIKNNFTFSARINDRQGVLHKFWHDRFYNDRVKIKDAEKSIEQIDSFSGDDVVEIQSIFYEPKCVKIADKEVDIVYLAKIKYSINSQNGNKETYSTNLCIDPCFDTDCSENSIVRKPDDVVRDIEFNILKNRQEQE